MFGKKLEFENEEGGFRVTQVSGVLRVQVWGFWNPDVARTFDRDALPMCLNTVRGHQFVLDATGLTPQGPEGQARLKTLLESVSRQGPTSGAIVVDSALTRLQLIRILKEANLTSWITI